MILFSERQKFRQWWIWAGLLFMTAMFLFAIYQQLILKEPFGNNSAGDIGLIVSCLIPLLIISLFLLTELETEITENEIAYKFFPFVLRKVNLPWSNIEKAYVRKYRPIVEYGGYGYRFGIFGYGRALNISGNMGLQLVLKNGKRLLLGTKKPEEMEKVILQLREKKLFDGTAS